MANISAIRTAASWWQISVPYVQQQANGKYQCHMYSRKLMANISAIRIAASDPVCLPLSPNYSARFWRKLQALVYDILPSTTAVFSYVIGSWKLSANEQFFVGAQIVISLWQTIQIKQGLSFIAANKVYTSTNKTTTVWIETPLFFLPRGGCVSCLRGCLGARLLPVISVDSCAEMKSAPSVA